MKLIAKLASGLKMLTDAMAYLAGAMLVAIVIIICIDVGMRYFLSSPQVWTVEICEYLVFGITFLGAPWLLRTGGHVHVDLITERLGPKLKKVLAVFAMSTGVLACAVLAYFGGITAIDCYKTGVLEVKTLDVPKYIFMAVLTFGYLMLCAEFIRAIAVNVCADGEEL